MFSSRLFPALRRFHGHRRATSRGRPTAVKYPANGQRPELTRISLMPARGIFSTGLPRRQPAALPCQAPRIRSGCTSGRGRRDGSDQRLDRRPVRRLRVGQCRIGGAVGDLLEQRRSQSAEFPGRRRRRGSRHRRVRGAPRRRPAVNDVIDLATLVSGDDELVGQQVLRLNPGHSHRCAHRVPVGCPNARLAPASAAARAASEAKISRATPAIVTAGDTRSIRDASATGSAHSGGTTARPPRAPVIAPVIEAIESASRP